MSAPPYDQLADILDQLPARLRHARQALGLSLRRVALESGCSHATVQRVETGEGCQTASAAMLLRWLARRAVSASPVVQASRHQDGTPGAPTAATAPPVRHPAPAPHHRNEDR